jgi:branched-chain amino acid transport system substrate-binding protein
MAIDDFGGKVLDRPIELLSGDHQNKADIASAMAREWFDSQGVDALVDVTGSAAGLAVNELAKASKKIVFYNSAATSRLGLFRSITPLIPMPWPAAPVQPWSRAVLIPGSLLLSIIPLVTILRRMRHPLVEKLGGKVLGSVKHPFNSPDFASQMRDDEVVPLICPTRLSKNPERRRACRMPFF